MCTFIALVGREVSKLDLKQPYIDKLEKLGIVQSSVIIAFFFLLNKYNKEKLWMLTIGAKNERGLLPSCFASPFLRILTDHYWKGYCWINNLTEPRIFLVFYDCESNSPLY